MKKRQIISSSLADKLLFASFLVLIAVIFIQGLGFAADGSGTNTVSPTSTTAGSTGNTFAFTFTAAETMDSGEVKVQAPTGWSAMQGTNGALGYTTVSSAAGVVADVLNALNAATNWTATQHMSLATSADVNASSTPASSLSFSNTITTTAAQNEQWYFNYGGATDWGASNGANGERIGFWLKSSVATANGDFSWQDDDTASLASPLDTLAIPALSANTWTYTSVTLGAPRATQLSYGFRYSTDIGAATFKADSISAIFDALDVNTNWSGSSGVSRALISTAGDFVEGTSALRCTFATAATAGDNCRRTAAAGQNFAMGPGTTVSFWVRSSIALNAGDFQWMDDDSATLASPEDTVDLPAISANVWTYITLTAANSANKIVRSYGFNQAVDKGAFTLDIDALGKVIDSADATTGWTAPTATVQTLSADSGIFHEGTASLKNVITAGAGTGDTWYQTLGSAANWSSYTTVGFWIRSTVATLAGDLQFQYSSGSDLTSPIATINIGALSADTWSYQKLTLSGTRTSVNSFGIKYATDIGAATVYLDDVLIGPGSLTFSGGAADARILSLSSGQTVVFTYGNGGGSSGVTAQASAGTATATTTSRISDSGILADVASQPTLTATQASHPSPTTVSISPTVVSAGGSGFSMVVNGTGFDASSTVRIGGSDRTTTFASSTQLSASILASDISSAGTRSITVFNPTPGGGTSNSQTLTVSSAPVAPSIQTFDASPSSVNIGESQTVTFTWSSSGTAAITCVLKDPGGSTIASNGASGTATTTQPQTTSVYTLTCTNSVSSAASTATVTASSGINLQSTGGSSPPPVNLGGYGPASAHFYGFTFPGSDIQVFAKSSVSGAYASVPSKKVTIADDGSFEIALEDFLQASYFFAIQAKDKNNNSTPLISFAQFAIADLDWTVKDIIVPPTLALDYAVVGTKSPVRLSGYAIPGATVNIFIDGKIAGNAKPDASGYYAFAATSTGLSLGSHSVLVKGIFLGKTSDPSLQKTFSLTTEAKSIVDLNGDQSANISDWSIFLSRWRSEDKKTQQTIDFNRDGKIDIKDFSIFLNAFQHARNSK